MLNLWFLNKSSFIQESIAFDSDSSSTGTTGRFDYCRFLLHGKAPQKNVQEFDEKAEERTLETSITL